MTTECRPEALAAAEWWVDQLASLSTHDNGDAEGTLLINYASAVASKNYTAEQIDAFRVALAKAIEAACATATWNPEEPRWASASRTVATDYGPDPILADAATAVGLSLGSLDLPIKTVMWVDPGEVTVAKGYGSQPVRIWPEEVPR